MYVASALLSYRCPCRNSEASQNIVPKPVEMHPAPQKTKASNREAARSIAFTPVHEDGHAIRWDRVSQESAMEQVQPLKLITCWPEGDHVRPLGISDSLSKDFWQEGLAHEADMNLCSILVLGDELQICLWQPQ